MWVFTKFGFFSAVKHGERMAIRARRREHLVSLKKATGLAATIRETLDTDYKYRIHVDRAVWSEMLTKIADGIDYDNFKSAVMADQGRTPYERALHEVWEVMHAIQK